MQEIKGFTLVDAGKFDRALNGLPRQDGTVIGGVGEGAYFDEESASWKRNGENLTEEELNKLFDALLAEYDRIGGLIRRGTDNVKTGSFWNFKARKPQNPPKVTFTYRINGEVVEVADGVELPGEVKAAKILAEKKKTVKKVKKE